jgi:hypothetical protein
VLCVVWGLLLLWGSHLVIQYAGRTHSEFTGTINDGPPRR